MTTSRTCIICGNPAGSGEHVFPAALGGRRTHNGIYCSRHNEDFSPFVEVLTTQLDLINAQLDVRHDRHRKKPASATLTTPGGKSYTVSGRAIMPNEMRIIDRRQRDDGTEEITISVPAHKIDEFRKQAEGKFEIIGKGVPVSVIQTDAIHFQLGIGGAKCLAAVSYVALTFLAKYHPNYARTDIAALKDLKQYLTVAAPLPENAVSMPVAVWWETDNHLQDLPASPFDFSHTVVISAARESGRVIGYVSLFGVFCFGVDFGVHQVDVDSCIVLHLDPLSPHPPNDCVEFTHTSPLEAKPPRVPTEHMRNAIESGHAEHLMHQLVGKIFARHYDAVAGALVERVQQLGDAPNREMLAKGLLDDCRQMVFNAMQRLAEEFKDYITQRGLSRLLEGLCLDVDRAIAPDANSSTGLTVEANAALDRAVHAVADQLLADHAAGELTIQRARALLAGNEGIEVIKPAFLGPLLKKHGLG